MRRKDSSNGAKVLRFDSAKSRPSSKGKGGKNDGVAKIPPRGDGDVRRASEESRKPIPTGDWYEVLDNYGTTLVGVRKIRSMADLRRTAEEGETLSVTVDFREHLVFLCDDGSETDEIFEVDSDDDD